MASHHTRAFNYESIRDQQEAIEMWRDIALGVGVVVLTIFCPPAGAVAGVVLAGAEMYSAATGKDWGTGRELSDGERILRGSFALFDLIPGAKYLHTVAKSGGKVAVKNVVKNSLREGFEQGAKNFDNIVKLTSKFGDNVLSKLDDFGRQADQVFNKLASKGADSLSTGLKNVDQGISQAAQNFRLNMGLEPQLVSGAMPSPGSSSINKISNKLDDFSKARKLRISDLDEVGDDTFTWTLRGEKVTLNGVKVKPVEYVKRSQEELLLLRKEFNSTVRRDFLQQLSLDKERLIKLGFTDSDILKLADGKVPSGYQVHHKLPLDDSGTNDFGNLVLIKNEPYHKVITNYQNSVARGLNVGQSKLVDWPIVKGSIYPNY